MSGITEAPHHKAARKGTKISAEPTIELWRAFWYALFCHCPRCGWGKLFDGFLKLEQRCLRCGLSYEFADSGDGPVVFVILIGGFITLGGVMWLASVIELSPLMQMALAVPFVLAVVALLLRPLKALMIGLQYRNKAGESRFGGTDIEK